MFRYIFSLIDYHSTIKGKMLGLQFLTEVTQPRFLRGREITFLLGQFSDPVDGSEQLLRTLPGLEV